MNDKIVGLIGLGLMGRALADRLIANGARVLGYDVAPLANAGLSGAGGTVVPDARTVFASCDKVLLSLPSDNEVNAVLHQAEDSLHAGQIILDTTTCNPTSSIVIAREMAGRHLHYLDATVSGSSDQVRRGETLWMVGGPREAFDQCADLFGVLARKAVHTGPSGTGSQLKLVTNLVLGLNRAALAEGIAFAHALGLDLRQTLEVLRDSMAYSRIMDTKGEKMIQADFQPQAYLSQHLKDVRLMLEVSAEKGLPLPLTETHRRLMDQAEAAGLGELDNSAIIEVLRKPKGLAER
jgi:3-hydroxyisobutyrate dehydrogenase-like beta-hydroxyacid dehydrogenase